MRCQTTIRINFLRGKRQDLAFGGVVTESLKSPKKEPGVRQELINVDISRYNQEDSVFKSGNGSVECRCLRRDPTDRRLRLREIGVERGGLKQRTKRER